MQAYWPEFLAVALAHLLAVASPGPDFAIIVRQSLCRGLAPSLWTSVGIGAGILVHVTYSLLGLGILISQSVVAFTILKWVGAAYLIYVGWQCLKAKPVQHLTDITATGSTTSTPQDNSWQAFRLGFLTNLLNAKATLFFVALFSVVISPSTPIWVQSLYGAWMCVATATWFMGLSAVLSHKRVKDSFARLSHWLERATGVVLLGLATRLVLSRD